MTIPVITTDRLVLRAYEMADFEPLVRFHASAHAQYAGGLKDRQAVWRDFATDMGQWHLLGFGSLAVALRSTGECIGQAGLNAPPEYPERELGWVLWEGFEGHGYAFEAASAMRDFAFETFGWTTLVSYIDPDNARSIRLAERLGAKLDKEAATPNGDNCLVYRHSPNSI